MDGWLDKQTDRQIDRRTDRQIDGIRWILEYPGVRLCVCRYFCIAISLLTSGHGCWEWFPRQVHDLRSPRKEGKPKSVQSGAHCEPESSWKILCFFFENAHHFACHFTPWSCSIFLGANFASPIKKF